MELAEPGEVERVDRTDEVPVIVVTNSVDEDVKVVMPPTRRWVSLWRVKRLGFLLTSNSRRYRRSWRSCVGIGSRQSRRRRSYNS